MLLGRVQGKLESAIWFLKRPRLFPQFLHLVRKSLFSRPEPDTHREAEAWCEERAIDIPRAVERITGSTMGAPVAEKFADVFAEASKRAESCPVTMGGPGALDLLYWVASRLEANRVVETGVAYGWSTLALLLALEPRVGARLVSVDQPYVRANNDPYVGIAVPETLKKNWRLIPLSDRQALPGALRGLGTIDLCHYDSDKSYAGRMWAYPRLWQALRPGGCFISDDINDNVGFRDFVRQLGEEPIVIRVAGKEKTKYVGALVKRV